MRLLMYTNKAPKRNLGKYKHALRIVNQIPECPRKENKTNYPRRCLLYNLIQLNKREIHMSEYLYIYICIYTCIHRYIYIYIAELATGPPPPTEENRATATATERNAGTSATASERNPTLHYRQIVAFGMIRLTLKTILHNSRLSKTKIGMVSNVF